MRATSNIPCRQRIFVHAPYRPEQHQAEVKKRILDKILTLGFEPQEFHISGIASGDPWTGSRAIEVMRQCDGALILALMRWTHSGRDASIPLPSEYSHFEGALALACNLPTVVFAEDGMQERGIVSNAGGSFVIRIPMQNSARWLASSKFSSAPPFKKWISRVRARYDVFFGYCSKADKLARNIRRFLTEESGLRVLDWATDFRPGRTIMGEVARATATCRCGLFLFTADDPIEGTSSRTIVPRDNVLLEAGYFMSAHGARRMVVVRESETKMPADLGGIIYLTIKRREDWKKTAKEVAKAVRRQMTENE